ncbi:MAG: hypothetical protein J0L92_21880 [Deltaproteobacteria bacterium]|nr:hypothetical protein [Deltaproteobacteria bacterium]
MRLRVAPTSTAPLVLLAAVTLVGCYRTNVRTEPDAGPPTPDAWRAPPPDAPLPDAWSPDAFVPVSECLRDRDCPSTGTFCIQDLSLAPRDLAAVPLRCGAPVGATTTGLECDSNEQCDHGMCALGGGCLAPCVTDDDCFSDRTRLDLLERCTRVPVVTSDSALQFANACVRWSDTPAEILANEPIFVTRFTTERLPVEPLRSGARLVHYVADARDDERFVSSITTSEGEVVFDAFGLGSERQPLVVAPFLDFIPVLIPNGDRDFAVGTSFIAALETSRTTTYRRIVMDRTTFGTSLDLNFYYVGVRPPRAGEPPAIVQRMLRELEILFAATSPDLRLGRMRHFVVPGATARRFEFVEGDDEVGQLFLLSAGASRPSVNVFLIRSGADFLGISGGAPGLMGVHGAQGSGIAIGLEDLESFLPMAPENQLGTVIGHELGHFTGLFHTTELDGTSVEPFADTPLCDLATNDLDGDGMLLPDECTGAGAENVMFWGPFVPSPRFSARQARILQQSMVLR